MYQYGYFKPLVARKTGKILTVRQLVPSLFVLALAGSLVAALWWRPAGVALGLILAAYGLVVGLTMIRSVGRCGPRVASCSLPCFRRCT